MHDFDSDQHEIETGERWLATFDTPGPSPEASAGVKRAIREQLGRRSLGRADRWPAWTGAVAAAAVLALSVTVVWQFRDAGGAAPLVAVSDWSLPEDIEADSLAFASLGDELTTLESWSGQSSDLDIGSLYDAVEDALTNADAGDRKPTGTSRRETPGRDQAEATT